MSDIRECVATLAGHVPDKKRPYDVAADSFAVLRVQAYDGDGSNPEAWLSVELTEVYSLAGSDRVQSRSITVVLTAEDRRRLLQMLCRCEVVQ